MGQALGVESEVAWVDLTGRGSVAGVSQRSAADTGGGRLDSRIVKLRVVRSPRVGRIDLLYCDRGGQELVREPLDSLARAFDKAQFLFGIGPEDWHQS